MIFLAAKTLQLIGMATVGYGLYLGIAHERGMTDELRLLAAGTLVFMGGWLLQRRSSS